jgi:monoamine oxidase
MPSIDETFTHAQRARADAPFFTRRKPELRDADIIVIGAGAAGIAAARNLRRQGIDVIVVEARDRVGGRAHTIPLAGQPVDIGAHWLHAAGANGLVTQAQRLGLALYDAPQEPLLMTGAGVANEQEQAAFMRRWEEIDAAMLAHLPEAPARSAASVFNDAAGGNDCNVDHRHDDTIRFLHGAFDSGVNLDDLDAADFAAGQDDADLFVEGGYGALIARLARGLTIHLETPVTSIDWSGAGVRLETPRGNLWAHGVIVTTPIPLLQRDVIRFFPSLPVAALEAIHGLRAAQYEHVVLSWPQGPFDGQANRIVAFEGDARDNLAMLANFDGGCLHYADLGGALLTGLADPADRIAHARAFLTARFGAEAMVRCEALAASDWGGDPWSGCAWTYAPVGGYRHRAALRAPVAERIHFAGEASSATQWGTIGGAWAEGERAAESVRASLQRSARRSGKRVGFGSSHAVADSSADKVQPSLCKRIYAAAG